MEIKLDAKLRPRLNLGCGWDFMPNYINVDMQPYKGVDTICNLEHAWPFHDNSIGLILADNLVEHLRDPIHTMKEVYRVLKPGGQACIKVPSTNGMGAFQDPTHKSFWNINSFLYYTTEPFMKYIGFTTPFIVEDLFEIILPFGPPMNTPGFLIPGVCAILRKPKWQSTSQT